MIEREMRKAVSVATAPLVAALVLVGCSANNQSGAPVPSDTSSVQENLSQASSCEQIADVLALSDRSARSLQAVGDNLAKLESDVEVDLQPHVSELATVLQEGGKPSKVLAAGGMAQTAHGDLVEQCDEAGVRLPKL
jgi:hypothetical protein